MTTMKLFKYILPLFALNCFGAVEYDLTKGTDISALTNITANDLNNLVDLGTMSAMKGAVIVGTNVPDVKYNKRYTNFLWIDTAYNPAYIKQWVSYEASLTWTALDTNWNNSTNWAILFVPNNYITSNKIADFAVGSRNIATNAINASYMIANNVINSNNLATDSVRSNHIRAYNVYDFHIATNTVKGYNMATGTLNGVHVVWPFITNVGMVDPNVIVQSINSSELLVTNKIQGSNIVDNSIEPSKFTNVVDTITIGQNSTNALYVKYAPIDVLDPFVSKFYYTAFTNTYTASGLGIYQTNWVNLSDLTVTVNPKYATNRFFLKADICGGGSNYPVTLAFVAIPSAGTTNMFLYGETNGVNLVAIRQNYFPFFGHSTLQAITGNEINCVSMSGLYQASSTNALTFTVMWRSIGVVNGAVSTGFFVNKNQAAGSPNSEAIRTTSTLTVMEGR